MKKSRAKAAGFPLGPKYVPTSDDVVCGRGNVCYNHEGNRRFRDLVHSSLERYTKASTRHEKGLIVISIVDTVRQRTPNGGFIKKDSKSGEWYEIGDHSAREKVGQTIREALTQQDPKKRALQRKKRALNRKRRNSLSDGASSDSSSEEVHTDEVVSNRSVSDDPPTTCVKESIASKQEDDESDKSSMVLDQPSRLLE